MWKLCSLKKWRILHSTLLHYKCAGPGYAHLCVYLLKAQSLHLM